MKPDPEDILGDIDTWVEAYIRNKTLRAQHPYIGDLIRMLKGFQRGRSRQRVMEILERERKDAGLPIPKNFDSAVQASFNRHSADSMVFARKKSLENWLCFSHQEAKEAVHGQYMKKPLFCGFRLG